MVAGLQEFVSSKGDDVAIIDEYGQWTWREANARANALVDGLRHRGLRDGDVVAILCGNRHEYLEVLTACTNASWIVVPVNWHFAADEIAYILENSGARAFVTEAMYGEKSRRAVDEHDVDIKVMLGGEAEAGFDDYEQLLAASSTEEPAEAGAGAMMFYTSGTTGRPRA
ncbi:MAG: AMP-binding protein [Acidimicrobiia bacterium]|nr:AMP-binding protein [Acidimicrobiia bacterium]